MLLAAGLLGAVVLAACGSAPGRSASQPPGVTTSPSPQSASAGTATPTPTAPTGSAPTVTPSRSPTAYPTLPPTMPPTAHPTGRPSTARPTPSRTPTPSPSPSASGLPDRLLGVDWTRIPTTAKVVALTFDAGANPDGVSSVLATLARERVPATFFLTGRFAELYQAQARALAAAGRIGDHTFDHLDLTKLTDAQVRAQVQSAASEILAVTGRQPAPWFRFPYGARDTRTIALVNSIGYVPVRWTVDTLGWEGTTAGITTASVLARVVASERPGEIVLMHLGSNPTDHSTLDADALPAVIASLRAAGYGFVTVDALAG